MALYALGDTHLSFSVGKPMDIFGNVWENHTEKLTLGLSTLKDDDMLVLCGDTSWALSFAEVREDFAFIDVFPGKKLLVKGNHDFWWTTAAKMRGFFAEQGFSSLDILHNNARLYGEVALCGTRGWFYEEDGRKRGGHDEKIFLRECQRLEASLKEGLKLLGKPDTQPAPEMGERLLVFLHYPPLYEGYRCDEIVDILTRYGVKRCFYGHLHGVSHARAIEGDYRGVDYRLVSADYVGFKPVRVL